jgi:hypothetical protein
MDPYIDISNIITKEQVKIPSTIEVINDPDHGYLPGYKGYRGVSFFRTQFETTTTTTTRIADYDKELQLIPRRGGEIGGTGARIQFQACSFYCRVWLNGIEIGDHTAGGYVSWWLDVPFNALKQGQQQQHQQQHQRQRQNKQTTTSTTSTTNTVHELFVLVDNRFNHTTAPLHTGGDFWHYGGILRSVEWHEHPTFSSVVDVFDFDFDNDNDNDNDVSINRKTSFSGHDNHDHDFDFDNNFILKEKEHPTTTIASENFITTRKTNLLSSLWPWRLYVFPQKDLRTVKLTLQLWTGGEGGEEEEGNNNTNTTYLLPDDDDLLLKELIKNNLLRW